MKAQSSVIPNDFWIRKRELGQAHIILRKNIETKQREEDEGTSTYYEYDEVETAISDRRDLADYVDTNFDALFDLGVTQSAIPKPMTDKERIEELEEIVADMIAEQLGVE